MGCGTGPFRWREPSQLTGARYRQLLSTLRHDTVAQRAPPARLSPSRMHPLDAEVLALRAALSRETCAAGVVKLFEAQQSGRRRVYCRVPTSYFRYGGSLTADPHAVVRELWWVESQTLGPDVAARNVLDRALAWDNGERCEYDHEKPIRRGPTIPRRPLTTGTVCDVWRLARIGLDNKMNGCHRIWINFPLTTRGGREHVES